MGLISKMFSFTRKTENGINTSDVKIDPGGGANLTAQHFSSPGDDSHPLPSDYVATIKTPASGGQASVGYADSENSAVALPGEKRIYGRDPVTGNIVNEVYLKSDSSIVISNAIGSITMNTDGSVNINGATITAAGDVISALGKSLSLHVHGGVTSGPSSTLPPT